LKVIGMVIPLKASADDESIGLDLGAHGEEAYVHTGGTTTTASMEDATVSTVPRLQSAPVRS
jgi:hypothetical protein